MFYEEEKIQMAFVRWMLIQYPKVMFTCSPATAKSAQQGIRNRRMGYRRGWPDLFFAAARNGFYGLFIEFKTKTGTVRHHQNHCREVLNEAGYKAVVCRSFEEAVQVTSEYLG